MNEAFRLMCEMKLACDVIAAHTRRPGRRLPPSSAFRYPIHVNSVKSSCVPVRHRRIAREERRQPAYPGKHKQHHYSLKLRGSHIFR